MWLILPSDGSSLLLIVFSPHFSILVMRIYDYFQANETAVVHCGFYSDHGGFKISEDDKSYMETCKAVVSTCAFGGGDYLYQPIGMTEASLEKVLS